MSADGKAPCPYHRDPDGRDPARRVVGLGTRVFHGLDEVVGKRFTAAGWGDGDGIRVYECFGHDPRNGFWVRTIDDGVCRQANISERAIGATYHRLKMTWGAWRLLETIVTIGRLPTTDEAKAEKLSLELAFPTLIRNQLVDKSGALTERGQEKYARREELQNLTDQFSTLE